MNLEFALVVDGEVRGQMTITMTPFGPALTVTGDVEVKPLAERPHRPCHQLVSRVREFPTVEGHLNG